MSAPPLLKLYADALERYHSGDVRYVKLLDGGLVDNYGLAAFTIARLVSDVPYGPLEPEEAVKLRRMLFLVVDLAARLPAPGRRPWRARAASTWSRRPRIPRPSPARSEAIRRSPTR